MTVYFIVEVKTSDENKDAYVKYIEKVRPIVEKYNGRYLARGGKITPVFGGWNPERIVIIEFPSKESIEKWLNSSEYKEIAMLRESSTVTKAIIVDGCGNEFK